MNDICKTDINFFGDWPFSEQVTRMTYVTKLSTITIPRLFTVNYCWTLILAFEQFLTFKGDNFTNGSEHGLPGEPEP